MIWGEGRIYVEPCVCQADGEMPGILVADKQVIPFSGSTTDVRNVV